MFRRPLMLAPALAAGASLLLSGCGGSTQDHKAAGGITGADSGAKTATPSPTGEASDGTDTQGRPPLKTDKDFKEQFESWSSGDRKTNSVLLDGKMQMLATNSAIFKSNPEAPEIAFYNDGPALKSAREWVTRFKKENHTLTGRLRYYEPRVKFLTADYATLIYCTDESEAFSKETRTGKVLTTDPSKNDLVLYVTGMKKGANGIWKTHSLSSERGKCSA